MTGIKTTQTIYAIFIKIVFLFFFTSTSFAQNERLDKLIRDTSIERQVIYYSELTRHYFGTDFEKAKEAAIKSFEIGQESKIDSLIFTGAIALGNVHWGLGEFEPAEKYYVIALEEARKTSIRGHIAVASNGLAMLASQQKNFEKTLSIYKESLDYMLQSSHSKLNTLSTYSKIGDTYTKMGIIDSAIQNYYKALELSDYPKLDKYKGAILVGLGNAHKENNDYDKAIEKIKKAVVFQKQFDNKRGLSFAYNNLGNVYFELDSLDLAETMFLQSLELKKELGLTAQLNTSYGNLGRIYDKKKDYLRANFYVQKAIVLQKQKNDKDNLIMSYQLLASISNGQAKSELAIKQIDTSIVIAKELSSYRNLASSYHIKSEVLRGMGKHKKAYDYLYQYDTLSSSLLSEEHRVRIDELETKYKTTQLEKETAEQEIALQKERARRNFLAGGLFGLLLLSASLFRLFLVSRKQKQLEIEKREIETRNLILEKEKTGELLARNQNLLLVNNNLKKTLKAEERKKLLNQTLEEQLNLGGKRAVKLKDIAYIQIKDGSLSIYLEDKTRFTSTHTLTDLEKLISQSLIPRIHRNQMVNLLHVEEARHDYVLLKDKTRLNVGKAYRPNLKTAWQNHSTN